MGDFRRQRVQLLIVLVLFLTACSPFKSKRAPIILVLTDATTESDFLCSDPDSFESESHLAESCEKFLRFTHFFSPSNLLQPNLASLMTGQSISQHQVENNGRQGVSGQWVTLAERALSKKMRTGFFSGGVPLQPKFGVAQGFEFFNDSFKVNQPTMFRPSRQNIDSFLSWLDKEVQGASFFSVLYFPDLLHGDYVTKDSYGVERPLGRGSVLAEMKESLDYLVGELKQRKLWDRSYVIFAGIGGKPIPIESTRPLSALYFHMPLQIKLPQSVRQKFASQIGSLFSFEHLGRWMDQVLQIDSKNKVPNFESENSTQWLSQENRLKAWLGLASRPALGLRRKKYLFSYNPSLQVFDSFLDKQEVEPLNSADAEAIAKKYKLEQEMMSHFSSDCKVFVTGDCPNTDEDSIAVQTLSRISRWLQSSSENPTLFWNQLRKLPKQKGKENKTLVNWLAYRALYGKEWTRLFELGRETQDPAWMMLARINLREPIREVPKGCLRYFIGESKRIDDFYQYCPDSKLRRVVAGLNRLKRKQRPEQSFWLEVASIRSRRQALNLNIKMQFINHLKRPFDFQPELSELYFFLPKNTAFQRLVRFDESHPKWDL